MTTFDTTKPLKQLVEQRDVARVEIARDLGKKLNVHLQRFGGQALGDHHHVWILYVTHLSGSHLPIEDAQKYLAWLDAGNCGQHHRALRKVTK